MKVLMLGWELPPYNAGGMGVECLRLCKALARNKVDIEFVLPYTADHRIDFMKVNSAHPQNAAQVSSAGTVYDSFRYTLPNGEPSALDLHGQIDMYASAVERIALLGAFDVIHAHDWMTCRAAIRAKLTSGKPLLLHMHSIESDRSGQPYGGNPLVREIEALGLQLADTVIAVSNVTKANIVREYGIPDSKIAVVHNNIDVAALPAQTDENAYAYLTLLKRQGYRVVSNVGRLTIQKGLTHLLHAFSLAVQYVPKTVLLIVGSGEQYHELIELAAGLGIADKVLFTEFQRGKRWRDAFAIADLFVLPSVSEPFGLTGLEAIGYGTPLLVSKEAGVAEVIRNALRVDFWDHQEMASQMVAVLQHNDLRDELQRNAFAELERLSRNDKTADKLRTLYGNQRRGVLA